MGFRDTWTNQPSKNRWKPLDANMKAVSGRAGRCIVAMMRMDAGVYVQLPLRQGGMVSVDVGTLGDMEFA